MSFPVMHLHNMQCDREFAARQPIIPGLPHPHVHENHQLAFAAVTIILVGGGMIQHFGGILKLPFPYTMLLLVYGLVLGLWVLFDPNFTLQPGMIEGTVSWSRDLYPGYALPPAVLQWCTSPDSNPAARGAAQLTPRPPERQTASSLPHDSLCVHAQQRDPLSRQ
jgi:hypothetical protein